MRRCVLVVVALAVAACGNGGDDSEASGVVIDVVGGLTTVDQFTIRTTAGEDLTFEVADGVRFHGSGPLGHLRSHLTTGEPIVVVYETGEDGVLRALEVDDG